MSGIVSRIRRTAAAKNWFLAAALLVALAAAVPLFFNAGLLNTRGGGDSPFLLQRLQQLTTALADGHFPARWMPDANYGYGYPFFNYYAPLSIYVAGIFRFLGATYVLAIKLAQLAGFVLAAWGMFHLGRRWLGSDWAGLLAAAAYTLAPFHMVNVYVRGDSLAEFWAMAFYPLVVLAVDHLALATLAPGNPDEAGGKARRLGAALFALVYSGLILSHNVSALIFTPFLLLYLLFASFDKGSEFTEQLDDERERDGLPGPPDSRGRRLLWVALSLSLALALAAWFWIPALAESSLAQLKPVTEGYFHYSNHFRDQSLVQRTFLFDYDPAGGRVFGMGLVQAATVVLGAAALLIYGRRGPNFVSRGRRLYLITGLLLATFMITSLSAALWDQLPLLSFTQFPWRFLSIQAFFGALATGGLALLPGRRLIVPPLLVLLLVTSLAGLSLDFLPLTGADVTAERLAQYEWYSGNIGTTISAEYLPESVQPRPQTSQWLNLGRRDAVRVMEGELTAAEPLNMKTASQEWRVVAGNQGAAINLPTMAWPGWAASMDGDPLAVEVAPGSGLISLRIPPGEHLVELKLGRTPARLAGEIVALAALVAWAWLLATGRKWRLDRWALYLIGGLLLLVVGLRLLPEVDGQENDLNWDFAQMAYLHHGDEGVPFDNGARLDGYSYSSDELATGDTLIVTLNWAGDAPGQARLALATPASNRSSRPPFFAQQVQDLVDGAVRYELAIPENAPAGLVVPRLTISEADPLTPSGLTRGELSLRPVLLRDTPQPAGSGEDFLDARVLNGAARDERLLDLQLQWLTRQALSQNYNYSLRIVDNAGREVVQQDGQPGYGFLPSSGWLAGQWTDDWIALTLPPDLRATAPDGPFSLVVRLYDVASGDVAMTRLLGQLNWQDNLLHYLPHEPAYSLPEQATPLVAGFGPAEADHLVSLAGYTLNHESDQLDLTLYWTAATASHEDLYHFVHVEDTGGAVVAQHDGLPRHNTYPTSQWLVDEVVADPMRIDLDQLPAGEYKLHVGLYRLQNGEAIRVPVASAEDQDALDDRLQLPEIIVIRR